MKTIDLRAIENGYIADGTYRLTVDGYYVGIVTVYKGVVVR